GASSEIGVEIVRLYLSLGANVSAHYHSNVEPLKGLAKSYRHHTQLTRADLSNEADVVRMFEFISQQSFGPVQIAVLNHGSFNLEEIPTARMSLHQWNTTLSVNLTSSFLVSREYLRGLEDASAAQKDEACIVLIGSAAGKYGEAGRVDYAAIKSGLMTGLTLSLKNEIVKIAPRGRVNCVVPGWVKTQANREALEDPEIVYKALATVPLKKVATTKDIANQIAIISSATVSGHVTGQWLMIDGGMEGRLLNQRSDIHMPI
ncbi:hypothetical protein SERLA73DRAFT_47597, partial [Serpula lacrymans var. lacrymans S7.3]